jgi:hypothetical protein
MYTYRQYGFGVMVLLAWTCFASAADPLVDSEVSRSIHKGRQALLGMVSSTGEVETTYYRFQGGGAEALTALTLLDANLPATHKTVIAIVEYLKVHPSERVFARAMRCQLWTRLGKKYARGRDEDSKWLVAAQNADGGWGEILGDGRSNVLDTADALLSLQVARDAGVRIPESLWTKAATFLTSCQNRDGGMGYSAVGRADRLRGQSHGSATAAGAAGLGVCVDRARMGQFPNRKVTSPPGPWGAYTKALDWLTRHVRITSEPGWIGQSAVYRWWYWLSFAPEIRHPMRLGQMRLDALLASTVIPKQQTDGGFLGDGVQEDDLAATVRGLRTLVRVHRPVLIEKRVVGGNPDVDLFDARRMCQYVKQTQGVDMSWRRSDDASGASSATILYLVGEGAAHVGPGLQKAVADQVRTGGVVIVQAIGNDATFTAQIPTLFQSLDKSYRLGTLSGTHPLMCLPEAVNNATIRTMEDGSRRRVFLLDSDFSGPWATGPGEGRDSAFAWIGNLVSSLRRTKKLTRSPQPAPVKGKLPTLTIDRLQHGGDWNAVAPLATSLTHPLYNAYTLRVSGRELDLAKRLDRPARLLWATGTEGLGFTPVQRRRLGDYIKAGGMVVFDATGKSDAFLVPARQALINLFGADSIHAIPADHPLLSGAFGGQIGCDARKAGLSLKAAQLQDGGQKRITPRLEIVQYKGRVVAVVSPLNIAAAAQGDPPLDHVGYLPDDAKRIALNLLLYAHSQP